MDPVKSDMLADGHSAAMCTVGGLLFLGTCVLLLLHCASSSGRKKRRQVEDRDVSGYGDAKRSDGSGNGISAQNQKWHESQKKQLKKKLDVVKDFPVIQIVITPPSPRTDQRSGSDGSEVSSDDLTQRSTSDNVMTQNDAKHYDVSRGDHDANNSVSCHERGSQIDSSMTSLSGIGDVNFVTSEEVSSERGEDLPPEDFVPRPRLASMEPGTTKSDYCIIVVDKSGKV